MTESEVFNLVKNLVVEKLSVEPEKVTMAASFRKDLGADSLDTYDLVYALEEETGVSIADDEANGFETVGDAVNYLMKELN